MTAIFSKAAQIASDTYKCVSDGLCKTPAVYAEKSFIQKQRITAAAMIALSMIASAYAPLVGGLTVPFAFPVMVAGTSLLGLSLIQEVIGKTPGTENARFTRIFAGINFLCPTPVNWFFGGLLWLTSDLRNGPARSQR